MPTPVEILMDEHRVIEQVLACVEKMADRCAAGAPVDADSARNAVDFLRTFADTCHHGKEEDCLFPAMEKLGVPREGGPIGVMLEEHEMGRRHIRGMSGSIDSAAAGAADARRDFQHHARAYVDLLRQHILKEDNVLFPMADQVMAPADQKALMDRFEQVEHHDMGTGTHEKYLGLAHDLAQKFGITPEAARAHHAGFA